jgi:arsenate reductase (thioredoxin)
MKTYLFACVHNAGRSQMAAAWFRTFADPTKARVVSAGTAPAERVHPEVVAVMLERGVDLSNVRPTLLTDAIAKSADLLVTMGCGEACPHIPGLRRADWPLPDPKGAAIDAVRRLCDEIRDRARDLAKSEGVLRADAT